MLNRLRQLFVALAVILAMSTIAYALTGASKSAACMSLLTLTSVGLHRWTDRFSRIPVAGEVLCWTMLACAAAESWMAGQLSGSVMMIPVLLVFAVHTCSTRASVMIGLASVATLAGLAYVPGMVESVSLPALLAPMVVSSAVGVIVGGFTGQVLREQGERADERSQMVASHQAELVRARDDAHAASRAKSAFLANMSHEIRTPLNAVVGMAQVLLDTELDETQAEAAHTIHSSGSNVVALINDILDFSRAEADAIELAPTEVDVRKLLGETLALFGPATWNRGVELVAEVAPSLPHAVFVDELRLRQIVTNLVSNAVKFTSAGSIHVNVSMAGRERLRLTVKDTGIGIPGDSLERLFEPFRQADSSTTRRFGGTGLGLAITAGLIDLMDGQIECTSEVGKGTCFVVDVHAPALRRSSATIADTLGGEQVLLALHRPLGARVLHDRLRRRGARVTMWPDDGTHNIVIISADNPEMDEILAATRNAQRVLFAPAGTPRRSEFTSQLQYPLRWDLSLSSIISGAARGVVPKEERFPSLARLSLKVLVAEDNPVNQRVIGHLLSRMGVKATMVADGREAVDAVRRETYDVVFMDLHMPHLDGIEATTQIRQDMSIDQPRIVALTASVLDLERKACLEAGMDGFVAKPIRVAHIVEALQQAVQTKQVIPV